MSNLETLEVLARGAASGIYIGLAVLCGRGGATPARIAAVLFCIAAAAHTLTQMDTVSTSLGVVLAPMWAASVMGSGLFWLFVRETFEDRPAFDPRRLAPALLLLVLGVAAWRSAGTLNVAMSLAQNILGVGLIIRALFLIARGWRGDLVETRRRLRGPILAAASIYALAVFAVQIWEVIEGAPSTLSPVAALSLVTLALLSLAAFGRAEPELFGAARRPQVETAPVAREVSAGDPEGGQPPAGGPDADIALTAEDLQLAAELERLMSVEKIYREEGLTISTLAQRLRLPEHRLRQLINQRLGYRNFSAFLNHWRIGEAKAALGDPSQREVPISTIALDAGFASLGPFNRAFKAETGLTPSDFRAARIPPSD